MEQIKLIVMIKELLYLSIVYIQTQQIYHNAMVLIKQLLMAWFKQHISIQDICITLIKIMLQLMFHFARTISQRLNKIAHSFIKLNIFLIGITNLLNSTIILPPIIIRTQQQLGFQGLQQKEKSALKRTRLLKSLVKLTIRQ